MTFLLLPSFRGSCSAATSRFDPCRVHLAQAHPIGQGHLAENGLYVVCAPRQFWVASAPGFRVLSRKSMLEKAQNVRLVAAITFHYIEQRLSLLYDVVREICLFPCETSVFIFTNITSVVCFEDLRASFPTSSIKIISHENLSHPYNLTWSHKDLIRSHFIDQDFGSTHFLYLEDDERFSFGNLQYFLDYRKELSEYGLLPGFVRTEWCSRRNIYVNTDNIKPQDLTWRPYVAVGDVKFTSLDNPYMGMFLLDRESIAEYARSKSFNIEKSKSATSWEVRERAAMGLMFEKVPEPFQARCVVGLIERVVLPKATIRHLPNNYADDPNSQFGKIPMAELVTGDFGPSCLVQKRQSAWLGSRLWPRRN